MVFISVRRGTSVNIVSRHGMDHRAIEVLSPVEAKTCSTLCVQTSSGAHPASYPMGSAGPFLGTKARQGRHTDHLPPSSTEVENE
jgi:hypothetical protein